jgi:hypothetical protein
VILWDGERVYGEPKRWNSGAGSGGDWRIIMALLMAKPNTNESEIDP